MTEPRAGSRRGYAVALGLLVVGAVLLIVAFGRTWSTTTVGGAGLPTITVALTGTDLTPAGVAVAVLALAGVAGLVATRRAGRIVIGALLVLAGTAVAYIAWDFSTLWDTGLGLGDTIRNLVGDRVGRDVVDATTSISAWWLVAVLAGVLLAVGGVLAVVTSGRWPEMGRRYERAGASAAPRAAARAPSAWDQLDQGIDPTDQDPVPGPGDTATDPTLGDGGRA